MPQIEVKGETEEIKQRIKSLLNSSGLQVFGETPRSLRFRKVRLSPNGRLPLSIYGNGEMRFEPSERGSTGVIWSLNISPTTVFSFAVTGLSIVIFTAFIDYFLLTSGAGMTSEVIVDILVVSIASLLVILVLILSFFRTRRRAEKFLYEFLQASSKTPRSE
jgi:hypothetical protein